MKRTKKLHVPGSFTFMFDGKRFRRTICGFTLEDDSRNFIEQNQEETCKNCKFLIHRDRKAAMLREGNELTKIAKLLGVI